MYNYHTHTYRCKHASGDIPDYVQAALQQQGRELGFSDHCPFPDQRWESTRMDITELDSYLTALETAQEKHQELILYKGLECEWLPEYHNYLADELLGEKGLDYLIGALHWIRYHGDDIGYTEISTPSHLKSYAEQLIKTMETGLFSFIAHPDAFGAGWDKWDENAQSCAQDILQAASQLAMPLEINGYGFRKTKKLVQGVERLLYPWDPFWELAAQYNISVVCNSDAHRAEDVYASISEARTLAQGHGLNMVKILPKEK